MITLRALSMKVDIASCANKSGLVKSCITGVIKERHWQAALVGNGLVS